jgi:Zn-dependent protease with chaperone function
VYRRPREPGVEASRDRFPRLFTALEEVSGRLKAPLPGRVVLVPGVTAYVYQHRPPRRLFRRELVLGLGVGSLPLLSDLDLKAILAHELAHFGQSHTRLHGYFAGAERVLYRTLDLLQGARQSGSRRYFYGYGSRTNMTADLVASVVSLPVRALWMGFHLVRMAESRAAEFAADRAAARAYGTQAFVDGLTGLRVADRTLRGAGPALAAAMRQRGEANFYAELRRHYASLPPAVIVKLRQEAVQGFRTLDQTHPVTPDRVRALYLAPVPPLIPPTCPASDLVVPEGVAGADALERELTALLLD